MTFQLPPLPFEKEALAPHMSAQTLDFHHGKHHQKYVDVLNDLVAGTPLADQSLEQIITATAGKSDQQGIFNNAAQVWNHTFFWHCLKPQGGGAPSGALAAAIDADFGSLDAFKKEFSQAAATQFGSGWAWLVLKDGKLAITKTPNAENPMTQGQTPLATCDVWEHAYYLDYQNRRPDFVASFLENLINWDFVSQNYDAAIKAAA